VSLFTVVSQKNSIKHGQISVQSRPGFEQLINVFVVINIMFYNGILNELYKLQRSVFRKKYCKTPKKFVSFIQVIILSPGFNLYPANVENMVGSYQC
jgi:hypothetical protein